MVSPLFIKGLVVTFLFEKFLCFPKINFPDLGTSISPSNRKEKDKESIIFEFFKYK